MRQRWESMTPGQRRELMAEDRMGPGMMGRGRRTGPPGAPPGGAAPQPNRQGG